jgi:hypothetical protein
MADSSFDVVSKVDRQEVDNALNQAAKELSQRFDFRGTNASIAWAGEEGVTLQADTEERVTAALEVFKEKLIKRNISLKSLDADEPQASGKSTRSRPASSRASSPTRPRRSPRSSGTRAPRASRPRSRATSCGSAARSATTCRRSSSCCAAPTSTWPCSSTITADPRRSAQVRGVVRVESAHRPQVGRLPRP